VATPDQRRRLPEVSQRAFTKVALVAFIASALIVLTGAAVRLTGSGLGCPDWPSCTHDRLTSSLSLHPLVEFSNRLVTVAYLVILVILVAAAYLRVGRRRDLVALSWLLVVGVVADAVLGGIVVYTHLNPWLVASHLWLSLAMLVVSVVLHHRSRYDYGPQARADVASPLTRKVAVGLSIAFALVVVTGTGATGSGPHAGGSQGQDVAKRLPIVLHDAVLAHSALAMAFLGMVLGTFLLLEASQAPMRLRSGARRLLYVGIAQGAIGFLQYATHLPAWLVELHVLGALSLTIGVTHFQLGQVSRDREAPMAPRIAVEPIPA
jgi:heme a synthase